MINLKEALVELQQKDYRTIQEETAWKWASRSCASYENCATVEGQSAKLVCWTLAEEYYHEAVEHAALVEGNESLVNQVRQAVHVYQEKAALVMAPGKDPKELDIV